MPDQVVRDVFVSVFSKRLKEARVRTGISQERLGVLAGIDEMSASARMNQYERGKHAPDWLTVERLAAVLDTPVPYFYAEDDGMAALLLAYYSLSPQQQVEVLDIVKKTTGSL